MSEERTVVHLAVLTWIEWRWQLIRLLHRELPGARLLS